MSDRLSRLPTLNALKTFDVAARSRTLEDAAAALHVTHGAVSRQIRVLEEDLGETLFIKKGRGRELTSRGKFLADRLHEIFSDLSHLMEDFRLGSSPNPLSVSCEPTLCLKMLIRTLGDLKKSTELDVKLFAAGGPVRFEQDRIDLAVRREDFDIPSNLHVFPLGAEAVGPVVSPVHVGHSLQTMFRLLPQLHSATRPDAWSNWARACGFRPPRARKEMFEHHYLALEAAQAGHGIALVSVYMAASDIAAGLLIAPRRFSLDGSRYVCLSPVPFDQDPRRLAFASWLSRHMGQTADQFVPTEQ